MQLVLLMALWPYAQSVDSWSQKFSGVWNKKDFCCHRNMHRAVLKRKQWNRAVFICSQEKGLFSSVFVDIKAWDSTNFPAKIVRIPHSWTKTYLLICVQPVLWAIRTLTLFKKNSAHVFPQKNKKPPYRHANTHDWIFFYCKQHLFLFRQQNIRDWKAISRFSTLIALHVV